MNPFDDLIPKENGGAFSDLTSGQTQSETLKPGARVPIGTKIASGLDMVFGGGKVGEAIGTKKVKNDILSGKGVVEADYSKLSPNAIERLNAKGVPTTLQGQRQENASQVIGPTKGQVLGSALQSASLFTPVGGVAGGLTAGARGIGLKTGASALGKIGSGLIAGEVFDVASNLQEGKTGVSALKPGLATGIGGAIPATGVAKNVIGRFGERQAPRIINSLIKPLAKDFSYGKNPGRAVAESKIVANNFDDLVTKIGQARQSVGEDIGALGRRISTKPIVNIQDSLLPLDEAMRTAASQNNTTLLTRLGNVKRALTTVLEPSVDDAGNIVTKEVGKRKLTGLTFSEARAMLGEIGDITQFTGNPSDDKAVNMALKKIYGSIKEETLNVADKTNPLYSKQFRINTERYADLTSAEVAAKYRDKILERSNLVGLSPQIAGIGTALITMLATGGASTPAIIAGVTGAVVDKLASTPAFKTRVAALLAKKSPQEVGAIMKSLPWLQKFIPKGGAISPGDRLLETKAGQAAKTGLSNYVKDPQVGLSVKNITKNISSAEKGTLRDFMDLVAGEYNPGEKMSKQLSKDAQDIAQKYGFNKAFSSDKALSSQIGKYLKSINFKH